MTEWSVSLPDSLAEFVEQRAEAGGYDAPADYIRSLISEDQRRQSKARLDALIREGLDSPGGIEVDSTFWAAQRADLEAFHENPSGR